MTGMSKKRYAVALVAMIMACVFLWSFVDSVRAATPLANNIYVRVNYWDGTPCASGACTVFMQDLATPSRTWTISTGSLTTYAPPNNSYFIWYGHGVTLCAHCSWTSNAYTSHWLPFVVIVPPSYEQIRFSARLPCPGGGYHFSESKTWWMDASDNNYAHNLGPLTLGQGCQTLLASPPLAALQAKTPARTAFPSSRYICPEDVHGVPLPATRLNILNGICVIR